jgi:signal transduction histidine kinase
MGLILDDLVEFAQLSTEKEGASPFDSSVVLAQEVECFAEAIRRTGAVVTQGELPWVVANPIRFARVLQNLIGNALKYVGEGVSPRIHVEAAREGAFWRFSVSDNGIGIDPRHFGRIFEPFKRLHPRGRYDGTGLGLAICRKIVEGFGGTLSVRSSEGQGSTFSFTVAAEGEAAEDDRTKAP